MVSRPIIGIPTQTLQAIDGIPEGLPHSWVMNHRYFLAVTSVGAVPWMIPLLADDTTTLRAIYSSLDGVFIAGGVDVHPSSYGAEQHKLCGRTDPPRDTVELQFARWALEDGKPLLGVCRGMQIMNVATGGTLYQDCTDEYPGSQKHDYFPNFGFERDFLAHRITIEPGSQLHAAVGTTETMINSMHHQGVKTLGEGFLATAYAQDGLIEAIEAPAQNFAVGVQWHPEMLIDTDPGTRALFQAFIDASLQWRRNRLMAAIAA
ncbi:gamma-glutamyl-gamma-aminobutyrate hydrolase family protein [soil metagenome]